MLRGASHVRTLAPSTDRWPRLHIIGLIGGSVVWETSETHEQPITGYLGGCCGPVRSFGLEGSGLEGPLIKPSKEG